MPVPEVVHWPVVVPPLTVPPNPTVVPLEQIVWLPPALTTATLCTVTTTCAVCAAQVDWLPVEVSVNVTVPAVASSVDGAYVAFRVVASGENVPVPAVVHWTVVVPPLTAPPKPRVDAVEQIV